MNSYFKYLPNVFLAKCDSPHEKGECISVTTKYGKENECIVHNLIAEKSGYYYYSITRADGFDAKERANKKADMYTRAEGNARVKSDEYAEKSQKDADFLSLAEPIKIGHHSEKRHRKAIEDQWKNIGKSVEFSDKAEEYRGKAEYWKNKAESVINLSMPESLEYYKEKLAEATEYHEGLKSGKYPREHSYSLSYAKKSVNDLQKKYEYAVKLWG